MTLMLSWNCVHEEHSYCLGAARSVEGVMHCDCWCHESDEDES